LQRIRNTVGPMVLDPIEFRGEAAKILAGKQKAVVLPTFFSFTEEITGRSSHFSQTYYLVGVSSLQVLMGSQLWTPLDQTFSAWKTSLAKSVMSARGAAQLAFDPSLETIIDLCLPLGQIEEASQIVETAAIVEKRALSTSPSLPRSPGADQSQSPVPIDPDHSWLFYRTWFEVSTDNPTVVHKPLRTKAPPQPGGTPGQGGGNQQLARMTGGGTNLNLGQAAPAVLNLGRAGRGAAVPQIPGTPADSTDGNPLTSPEQQPGDPPDIIQKPVTPSYYVQMHVVALRLTYPIPLPQLIAFGGVPVTELANRIRFGEAMRIGGVPLYWIKGFRFYRCYLPPVGDLPQMGNPQFDVGG